MQASTQFALLSCNESAKFGGLSVELIEWRSVGKSAKFGGLSVELIEWRSVGKSAKSGGLSHRFN